MFWNGSLNNLTSNLGLERTYMQIMHEHTYPDDDGDNDDSHKTHTV